MASSPVHRYIHAPPSAVYRALTDGRSVGTWRAPDGMRAVVHTFDARQGGAFRITLAYDDESRAGKTAGHVDTYHGCFRALVADRQVVEVVEFETSDPEMQGEMTITTDLEGVGEGTEVTVGFDGLPVGISEEDNDAGTAMSLANLARLVEGD